MSRERNEIEDRIQAAMEEEHLWKSFMDHPGWAKFEHILRQQMNLRQQSVCLTPIQSVGQSFSQEFYKGEFGGIGLALATPQAQLELAQMERRTSTKELEIEDDAEAEVASTSSGFGDRIDGDPFGGGESSRIDSGDGSSPS